MQWCLPFLLLLTCARVPDGVCFEGEACADAGAPDASVGGGTGGGALGGGTGGGTGGGSLGGGGGTGGGTQTLTPVANLYPTWNIVEHAAALKLASSPGAAPAYERHQVAMPGNVSLWRANCEEAFRGLVALPGGRVLAIPYCAGAFVLLDTDAGTATAFSPVVAPLGGTPSWAGGVLGCDGRVYAFPFSGSTVRRFELDGGWVDLPFTPQTTAGFEGGVVSRPCAEGFEVLASSDAGVARLEIFEEAVRLTFDPSGDPTATFHGVARVGDERVVTGTARQPSSLLARMEFRATNGWSDTDVKWSTTLDPTWGLASSPSDVLLELTSAGTTWSLDTASGTQGVLATPLIVSDVRWPTLTPSGWVVASAREGLVGYAGDAGVRWPGYGGLIATSGGLVHSTDGVLVDAPGAGRQTFVLWRPVDAGAPDPGTLLSPWLDKL